MNRRFVIAVGLVFTLFWLRSAALMAQDVAKSDALAAKIKEVMDAPRFKTAHWGVLVIDRSTGQVLFEHQPDKLFIPASVTKLFSCATMLDAYGGDHRFKTPVYARGEIKDGGVAGDLIFVAKGDLTLGGRTESSGRIAYTDNDHTYAQFSGTAELTPADPLAGMNELAKQVAAAGIRQVSGDVLIDARLFDNAESSGSGPKVVSPIVVNDNVVDFTIEPAAMGQPAKVQWRPMSAAIRVDAQVATVDGDRGGVSINSLGENRFVVRGTIGVKHKPIIRTDEVDHPEDVARALFIEALSRAGVRVAASPLAVNDDEKLPDAKEYEKLKRVAELTSPPLSEEIKLILKVSHNLHASTLPLLVAAKHNQRTLADGLRRQGEFFTRAGMDLAGVSFGGGAGGTRSDHVTPRATVQLLRHMATRKDFAAYRDALPVLGVDGTLAKAVDEKSPARGKAFAKTGTLVWDNLLNDSTLMTSKALAGYATTKGGREVVLAAFVNYVPLGKNSGATREIGRELGKMCEAIYEHAP